MQTAIGLFRGINVGGKHKLAMNDLAGLLEEVGLAEARTYIQSGNVVFRTESEDLSGLASSIAERVEDGHGFRPEVLLLWADDFRKAAAANPFPEAESDPSRLHLSFLTAEPDDPDLRGIEEVRKESERWVLIGKVFYLHAPEGIGRSMLAAKAERLLGVPATARNWRTVAKLLEMID